MVNQNRSILLVGCGHMGSSLAKGWFDQGFSSISVLDPYFSSADSDLEFKTVYTSVDDISEQFDLVVLAVKPQTLGEVCKELKDHVTETTLILSVAAGKTSETIAQHFFPQQPVIRCMPNLPASIGCGVSVCFANHHCSEQHTALAQALIDAVGKTEWIDDEEDMHAVTALSGSGPAYLFHLTEAMIDAGVACGLSDELSHSLARQTIIGSARLLEKQEEISPSTLRENVTSKGGTTEAALNVLRQDKHFKTLMKDAIKAAQERSRILEDE